MQYNDKIKHIRKDILRMSQEEFADLLGVTQSYVSSLEIGGDKKRRLSRKKEATLIKTASLQLSFFEDDVDVNPQNNEDIFYVLVPEARAANLSLTQVRNMLKVISRGKLRN